MDGRANRAKIGRLVRRLRKWILLGRRRIGCRHAGDGRAACEFFEMDVSDRKDKLQRHRCKREPTPTALSGSSPTHWQTRQLPLRTVYSGADPGQIWSGQKSWLASINCWIVAR